MENAEDQIYVPTIYIFIQCHVGWTKIARILDLKTKSRKLWCDIFIIYLFLFIFIH